MTGNGPSHYHLLIAGDAEGAVVFSQPFIEPGWHVAARVSYQQVGVLVKNDSEGILLAVHVAGEFERDVIHVRTRLEITCGIRIWFERTIRLVVFENYYSGRHR